MDSVGLDTVGVDTGHGSPTLNDIISHHKLKEEHLQRECSKNIRLKIAKELIKWQMLGSYLNIPEPDLTAIAIDNATEDERRVAMLNKWHEREGRNATYLMLAGALYQHGRRDLVQLLCHTVKERSRYSVPQSKNEAMFRANEEKIRTKFALLIRKVRLALEENKVTTEDVRTILLGMFANCDDLIPNTNLEEMIAAVTREGLWNYMHHSPVEELLCNLLPQHKSLISQYKEHLSGYEATTTLIDYIRYTNFDSTRGSNKIPLRSYTKRRYQRLTVKLENERNITLLSLEYVQDLWQRFAEEFHIPSLTALINKIGRGCIEITWLVPPDVAKKIAASANKSIQFFRENNIVQVTLDDNPIHDQLEVEQCKANFKENLGKGIEEVDLHTPEDQRLVNFIDQNVQLDCIKQLDLATSRQTYTVIVNSKVQFCNITEFKRGRHAVVDVVKHEFITGILYTIFTTGFIIGLITGIITGLMGANQMFYGSLAGAIGGAIAAPIHSVMRDDEETKLNSDRLLSVRFFVISGLIQAFSNASIGAAMVGIGAAFIGSLIVGVLSRKAIKSIANATIFAISLGALVGIAVGVIGGTIPGTISGMITATTVVMIFDALTTGTFSAYANVVKTILRVSILNEYYYNIIMLANGAVIGVGVGVTAFYLNVTVPESIKIFYSIMNFLTLFCFQVINLVLGDSATGAFVTMIRRALLHLPNNPLFDPFRYKIIFAIIAAGCAAAGIISFFFPVYIIEFFTDHDRVDFPAPVGTTVLGVFIGAATNGYFLMAVLNNIHVLSDMGAGQFMSNNQSIAVLRTILGRIDVSIIMEAVGAILGTYTAFVIEAIAGEALTGVTMAANLAALTGIASGAIIAVAMAIIRNITIPAITKMCTDQEIIVITTASGFIGGVCGGYFISSVMAGILVALAFPVVTMLIYTASVYAERRHRFKRVNRVSLVHVMNKFGIELRNLTSDETQNNWIRYKIAEVP